MKKFFSDLFQVSPTASFMEKLVTYLAPIASIIGVLYLIVISYGVGNTEVAQSHKVLKNPGVAAFLATLCYLGAFLWFWYNWTDRIRFRVNPLAALLVAILLIILGVHANTNFFVPAYK